MIQIHNGVFFQLNLTSGTLKEQEEDPLLIRLGETWHKIL